MDSWGIVATIKAPVEDILNFAAYHIDLGAHRLYIYLDAPNPDAHALLKAHPKIRVITCDDAYWRRLGKPRPVKHQARQTLNATHAYGRRTEVDWLIHIDVDEFLWPNAPLGRILGRQDPKVLCARLRPIESICGDGTVFKRFIPPGPDRNAIVDRLYPTYGRYFKGGFLSHVAGKLAVRTGLKALTFKIHNVVLDGEMNPGQTELGEVSLCHCHAQNWDHWIASFRYRLTKGAYRAEIPPAQSRERGGLSVHEVLCHIETEEGTDGLRGLYDELCADTPELRARLEAENLLEIYDLQLIARRKKHFPSF